MSRRPNQASSPTLVSQHRDVRHRLSAQWQHKMFVSLRVEWSDAPLTNDRFASIFEQTKKEQLLTALLLAQSFVRGSCHSLTTGKYTGAIWNHCRWEYLRAYRNSNHCEWRHLKVDGQSVPRIADVRSIKHCSWALGPGNIRVCPDLSASNGMWVLLGLQ